MRLLNRQEAVKVEQSHNHFLLEESEIIKEDLSSAIKLLNRNRDEAQKVISEANLIYSEKMDEINQEKKEIEKKRKEILKMIEKNKVKIISLDNEKISLSEFIKSQKEEIEKDRLSLEDKLKGVIQREEDAKKLIGKASIQYYRVLNKEDSIEQKLEFIRRKETEIENISNVSQKDIDEQLKLIKNEKKEMILVKSEVSTLKNNLIRKEEDLEKREKLLESRNQTLKNAFQEAKLKGLL